MVMPSVEHFRAQALVEAIQICTILIQLTASEIESKARTHVECLNPLISFGSMIPNGHSLARLTVGITRSHTLTIR
jgi:hypothetical protein